MEKSSKPFIIPFFIPHAGCPHRCIFCNQMAITSQKLITIASETFRRQVIEFLKFKGKNKKPVQVAFYGGNFLGQKKENIVSLLSEASRFVQDGCVDSIRFSTRPDTIDNKRLNLLKDYPVTTIELGVQSLDNRVLARSRRGHTAADTEHAVQLLKDRDYEIGLQMMIGLPGDDEATAILSAQGIAALSPNFVRIYPTVVLAGSPLAKWYAQGKYTPLTLNNAVSLTKRLYLLFAEKKISVIRMGLQANEDLLKGTTLLAGPHHPSFGHLVYAEIFLDKVGAILAGYTGNSETITLSVHPRSVSKLQGIRNQNIDTLKKEFKLQAVHILPDDSLDEDDAKIV